MKSRIIYTVGLPACGKTTWAKEYVKNDPTYIRVSRDDLRHMRGIYWLPNQEDMITSWEVSCIETALENKYNVIIDATNLNKKTVAKWEGIAKKFDAVIEAKRFDVTLEECIARDAVRTEGKVGEEVIRGMNSRYLANMATFSKINQDVNLSHAIIVDLDGTLAIHNGRNPFDYDKCDTDLVNTNVANLVQVLDAIGMQVILMSGREDSCRDKTIEWLQNNSLPSYNLLMRKTGDKRSDDIVKHELFKQHVENKYHVELVLDDRDKVVKMWREIGLTCLQVAPGNF